MLSPHLQYKGSELHFGRPLRPVRQVLNDYQRPIFLYDLGLVEERYRAMRNFLPSAGLYYAMKANSHPKILRLLKELGAGVDVVSLGEIRQALQNGFIPADIVFSGAGKTSKEIREALEHGIHQFNVESIPEVLKIADIAKELSVRAMVSLRLNPNIDVKTHPYIATGLHTSKFGIELSHIDSVKQILRRESWIELVGVSMHLGSQMIDFDGFEEGLRQIRAVYEELKREFASVCRFNFGGGVGIIYDEVNPGAEEKILSDYAQAINSALAGLEGELQSEPGRFLVAHAGLLLSQVQYVKKTPYKNFLILDTGMHHLIRPALYGARHQILPVHRSLGQDSLFDVVGPICESTDFLGKDIALPDAKPGDFIAIADAGAYGIVMSSRYNLQTEPLEVAWG